MPILAQNKHRYPPEWKEISRRIRFDRAAGRCECDGRCGSGRHSGRCPELHDEAPQTFGGKRVVLTTAHLDHVPENNDDANLLALCQCCHLRYDHDRHVQSRRERAAKR